MNYLYLIKRTDEWDYDEYDALVVCSENQESALLLSASSGLGDTYANSEWLEYPREVRLIGTAHPGVEKGVILGSFNAG